MFYNPKPLNYVPTAFQEGGKSFFPFFSTDKLNLTTLNGAQMQLGDFFYLSQVSTSGTYPGGNAFMCVKAAANLTVGQLVTYATPTAGTLTTGSTAQTAVLGTSALTAQADVGNYFYVNNATTQMARIIKANAANSVTVSLRDPLVPSITYDADAFDTVPANSDPYVVYRPFNVIVNTASTRPVGVALGTVTSGNFTLIHIAGNTMISTVGSTTATIVNAPAVGAAAGVLSGSAAAAANLYSEGVSMIPQYAWNGAARLTPCFINFMGSA